MNPQSLVGKRITLCVTGSIAAYLKVTAVVSGTNHTPFSSILLDGSTWGPIGGAGQVLNAGLQWTELGPDQLNQAYTVDYTIQCKDTAF